MRWCEEKKIPGEGEERGEGRGNGGGGGCIEKNWERGRK